MTRMEERGPGDKWRVRTFVGVLTETQQAHAEMLKAHADARSSTLDEGEDDWTDEVAAAEEPAG